MSDITERLRDLGKILHTIGKGWLYKADNEGPVVSFNSGAHKIPCEAADEIDRLRDRIRVLEEALRKIMARDEALRALEQTDAKGG
jgi:hypothetical protein